MIANRGTKVWPGGHPETFCVDQWRCRFETKETTTHAIIQLLQEVADTGLDIIKTENLYLFDGKKGYS